MDIPTGWLIPEAAAMALELRYATQRLAAQDAEIAALREQLSRETEAEGEGLVTDVNEN